MKGGRSRSAAEDFEMTSEAIKILMIFALYGMLEIALFQESIGRLAKRAIHPGNGRRDREVARR